MIGGGIGNHAIGEPLLFAAEQVRRLGGLPPYPYYEDSGKKITPPEPVDIDKVMRDIQRKVVDGVIKKPENEPQEKVAFSKVKKVDDLFAPAVQAAPVFVPNVDPELRAPGADRIDEIKAKAKISQEANEEMIAIALLM